MDGRAAPIRQEHHLLTSDTLVSGGRETTDATLNVVICFAGNGWSF
jgi:hypothetical protein